MRNKAQIKEQMNDVGALLRARTLCLGNEQVKIGLEGEITKRMDNILIDVLTSLNTDETIEYSDEFQALWGKTTEKDYLASYKAYAMLRDMLNISP